MRQSWKPITFKNYDMKPRRMRIKNNGHAGNEAAIFGIVFHVMSAGGNASVIE